VKSQLSGMMAGTASSIKSPSCTRTGHPQSEAAGQAERKALLLATWPDA